MLKFILPAKQKKMCSCAFYFCPTAFGPQVEAVMDRIKDNISLDHMARLLVDVQQDSSGIVDSIISQHQRELLNLIFLGDAPNRNKVLSYSSFSENLVAAPILLTS